MKKQLLYVGLDVHAQTVSIAIAESSGEVRHYGTVSSCLSTLEKTMCRIRNAHPGAELRVCYEAGPTGVDSVAALRLPHPSGCCSATVCLAASSRLGCHRAEVRAAGYPLHGGRTVAHSEQVG
jgi:hypothetical protein